MFFSGHRDRYFLIFKTKEEALKFTELPELVFGSVKLRRVMYPEWTKQSLINGFPARAIFRWASARVVVIGKLSIHNI